MKKLLSTLWVLYLKSCLLGYDPFKTENVEFALLSFSKKEKKIAV